MMENVGLLFIPETMLLERVTEGQIEVMGDECLRLIGKLKTNMSVGSYGIYPRTLK